jgi:FkbM family methyltransferase
VLRPLLDDARVRAGARRVPGLSRTYWGVRRRIAQWRGVARLDYAGAHIVVRVDTKAIFRSRLHPVAKEPWTVQWLERNLRAGDVLYDVGANIGDYALIACAIEPASHVVALEPAFANYDALCRNVLLNRMTDAITPLPLGLGEATRLASLACEMTDAGAATHALDGGGKAAYRQPTLVYSLDDLVESFGLPAPTLVKIDVDGSERAVLEGAAATLSRPEARSVIVEVDVSQTELVGAQLREMGFALTARYDERDGMPLPDIWYGVFDRV